MLIRSEFLNCNRYESGLKQSFQISALIRLTILHLLIVF